MPDFYVTTGVWATYRVTAENEEQAAVVFPNGTLIETVFMDDSEVIVEGNDA